MATVPIELGETDAVLRWVIAQPGSCVKEPLEGRGVLATFGMEVLQCAQLSVGAPAEMMLAARTITEFVVETRKKHWRESGLPAAVGFASYDFGQELAGVLETRAEENDVPAWFLAAPTWWIEQTADGAWVYHAPSDRAARAVAQARLLSTSFHLSSPKIEAHTETLHDPEGPVRLYPDVSKAQYLAAFDSVRRSIYDGDYYLANLAQTFRVFAHGKQVSYLRGMLYTRLRSVSQAPQGCFLDLAPFQTCLLSASPERFIRIDGTVDADGYRVIETCPIKGTRPVHQSQEVNEQLKRELQSDAKERAELTMIIDLERNDFGRVCKTGSIEVIDPFRIETFRQVHHLVATVRGLIPAHCGVEVLIRNGFPGGSVTGAPKIAAIHALAELEFAPRGAYCGSVFWIGADGSIDSNILIRTMVVSDLEDGVFEVSASVGGGITIDSDPEREYRECFHKLDGVAQALEPWVDVSAVRAVAAGTLDEALVAGAGTSSGDRERPEVSDGALR